MNPTTFIEGTYGFIRNELTGGNENGVLINESSNRLNELAGVPADLPERRQGEQRDYYANEVLRGPEAAAGGTREPHDEPAAGLQVGRPYRRRAAQPAVSRAG